VRQGLSYRELADQLVNYVADLGYTHVELMPVMEHPYGPSGATRSPATTPPTARFGTPDDYRYLVDTPAPARIGVILDWVPAHFPKDAFALARFDGQALYEHPDPRRGDQPDWGTHVFDFGNPQVRNFLVANAIYWCEEFHGRRLRVDAVASMLYLDYSRKEASGPEPVRRARASRGRAVPAGDQRHGLQARPRRCDHRRGVDRLARCHAANSLGGLGFRL